MMTDYSDAMIILGIESSCDETAASVIDGSKDQLDQRILSNIVHSQLKTHAIYGGVVPEIAARAHLGSLRPVIEAAMQEANVDFKDLDGIAATCGPGLIGGVMIGMVTAKAIAAAHKRQFIAVNHLEGHALTPRLTHNVPYPYLLLLVSGGHTQLLIVKGVGDYERLGTTLDDALGEAFDKSAKMMGLPYPGGPALEKLAAECLDPVAAHKKFPLPRPMLGRRECHFSFSGLKTSVRQYIESYADYTLPRADMAMLACAFQQSIADILIDRCARAFDVYKSYTDNPHFVIAGGVAANLTIRQALENLCATQRVQFSAPPLALCTDNGAMIAWAGYERAMQNLFDSLDFAARPRWPLDPNAETAIGAGIKA
jgi:N6-L-threonylcarbamoyladenine synthase